MFLCFKPFLAVSRDNSRRSRIEVGGTGGGGGGGGFFNGGFSFFFGGGTHPLL